jgi:hypothetical protein
VIYGAGSSPCTSGVRFTALTVENLLSIDFSFGLE